MSNISYMNKKIIFKFKITINLSMICRCVNTNNNLEHIILMGRFAMNTNGPMSVSMY